MVQRRAADLGTRVKIGCHTLRATGITAYLEAGGTLENAQAMAAHESPRTTKLYDRTGDEITLDEVERISIYADRGRQEKVPLHCGTSKLRLRGEWWLRYGDSIRIIPAKSTYIASMLAACLCSPALASESGAALSSAVRDLSGVLANAIIAALVIAVIVYCLIELVKLPLRLYFNFVVFSSWKKTRRFSSEYLHHPPQFRRMGTQLFLSSDLFVKRLENRARAAMEGARAQVELHFFAAGATEADIASVWNALGKREPFDDGLLAASILPMWLE